MRHTQGFAYRAAIIVASSLVLLFPSALTATVWTSVNFLVALVVIAMTISSAILFSRYSWIIATISSLLIAVPPYPYWLFRSREGWQLHFFSGFNVGNVPILTFLVVFLLAMTLFTVIIRTLRK